MNAFDEHREDLERFEQMYGRERGRLAVSCQHRVRREEIRARGDARDFEADAQLDLGDF